MIIAVFLGGLVLLFLLGFGAPYAIGLVSLLVLIMTRGIGNIPLDMVATKLAFSANNFTLLAIPFFLLAGKLMNTGSITTRIFRFCNTLIGWIPGGLGHANVLASIVFAGMSGSAVADAAGEVEHAPRLRPAFRERQRPMPELVPLLEVEQRLRGVRQGAVYLRLSLCHQLLLRVHLVRHVAEAEFCAGRDSRRHGEAA